MFTRSGNVCQLFLNGDYCPFFPGIKYCIITLQMVVKHSRLSVLSYSGPRRVFTYKNNLYINMIQKLIADSRGLKANFRCKNTEMKMESQTFFLKKLKVTFRSLKNPFSSISVKKDSRGGSITSLPPAPILNRTGGNPPKILFNRSSGNPPTANFESNKRKSSPCLKQQGMISALLRGAKPIASLDQENCAIMEVSYKKIYCVHLRHEPKSE